MTRNSGGSGYVVRPTVTCRSPIASSNADCTFAGARLTSSASSRLWKIGPRWNSNVACLRTIDFGAGEVGGQQIGRELDAVEVAFDARGEFLDRRGLGQSRRAFDQQMAVGEQRDQQAVDERASGR